MCPFKKNMKERNRGEIDTLPNNVSSTVAITSDNPSTATHNIRVFFRPILKQNLIISTNSNQILLRVLNAVSHITQRIIMFYTHMLLISIMLCCKALKGYYYK